jgi:hypothetical protein
MDVPVTPPRAPSRPATYDPSDPANAEEPPVVEFRSRATAGLTRPTSTT